MSWNRNVIKNQIEKRFHNHPADVGTKGEEADVSDPANESGTNSPLELADGVEEIKLTDGQSPDSDPGVDVGSQQEEEAAQISGRLYTIGLKSWPPKLSWHLCGQVWHIGNSFEYAKNSYNIF